jgi:hypothetical protein
MPELRFAAARVVRKGEGPSRPPPLLHKVSFHLQAALEEMRLLPIQDLEREKFHTWIYHMIAGALHLIVEDEIKPPEAERPDEAQLCSDLKDILG